jgi:FkbM family methyltransferase
MSDEASGGFLLKAALRFEGSRISSLLNVTIPARFSGRGIRVPLAGGVGFDNLRPTEHWMDHLLPALLRDREGAFVDVGVNVGQTLIKLRRIDSARPYIGFEPNPVCYAYTQKLIAENGFEHCTLVPVGLSDAARIVSFHMRSDADVGASTVDGFRKFRDEPHHVRIVPVFTGDEMLERLGNPEAALLKVDVEGAELEVLKGFERTLAARPLVLCEILPLFSEDGPKGRFRKPRQDALLAFMRHAGYSLYRILPDATALPLQQIEVHRDPALTNYVFAPTECCALIESTLIARTAAV